MADYSVNSALEYWGGKDISKIVLSPCNNGELLSYYCFFPREKGDFSSQNWNTAEASTKELLAPYPDLDPALREHFKIATDIRPWRLWVHKPYEYWQKGSTCLMGDAAHPVSFVLDLKEMGVVFQESENCANMCANQMMPDQSQGACMALEDAAALGIVFGKKNFSGDVKEALQIYEAVRKPRATRVQAASARARENLNER